MATNWDLEWQRIFEHVAAQIISNDPPFLDIVRSFDTAAVKFVKAQLAEIALSSEAAPALALLPAFVIIPVSTPLRVEEAPRSDFDAHIVLEDAKDTLKQRKAEVYAWFIKFVTPVWKGIKLDYVGDPNSYLSASEEADTKSERISTDFRVLWSHGVVDTILKQFREAVNDDTNHVSFGLKIVAGLNVPRLLYYGDIEAYVDKKNRTSLRDQVNLKRLLALMSWPATVTAAWRKEIAEYDVEDLTPLSVARLGIMATVSKDAPDELYPLGVELGNYFLQVLHLRYKLHVGPNKDMPDDDSKDIIIYNQEKYGNLTKEWLAIRDQLLQLIVDLNKQLKNLNGKLSDWQ